MAKKVMETEKVEYVCTVCGATYKASPNRRTYYCSRRCMDKVRKARKNNELKGIDLLKVNCPSMTPEYYRSRKDKIAHQEDKSVWVSDYAERQKQRTLEMLGRVEI